MNSMMIIVLVLITSQGWQHTQNQYAREQQCRYLATHLVHRKTQPLRSSHALV